MVSVSPFWSEADVLSPLSLLSFPFQLYEVTCHFHNMLWKYHLPLASADSGYSILYFSLFLT